MAVKEFPTEAEPPRQPLRKPRRFRYVLAALLLVGGVALALGVGFAGDQAKSNQADGFARVPVPGVLTLHVDRSTTTYYVYAEGTTCLDYPNCHGQLYPVTVEVSGPAGDAVNVEVVHGPSYTVGGMEGTGVARFDATTTGNYRVTASTGPYSEGVIAVGQAFPGWTQDWVGMLAMGLMWAAGLLIVVLPIGIYYRRRRAAPTRDSRRER